MTKDERQKMIDEALEQRNSDPGLEPYTREELEQCSDAMLQLKWLRA